MWSGRGRMPIVRVASGRVLVKGTVRLKDAGDALGVPLEHEDVLTISGLTLALLGRPATIGDSVTYQRVRIDVNAVAGRGVSEATLSVVAPPPKP